MKYLNKLIDSIADYENINLAWGKAKECYRRGEYWFDQIEYAKFTSNLEKEILNIRDDILNNKYKMSPITPIFFPKGTENSIPQNRQMFWISIRDQVTWLAVLNVIGKFYDSKMPFWSYGHRLYVSIFPKSTTSNGQVIWGRGPYRNTVKNIYRNFTQSWPRFRRDVYISAKILTGSYDDLDQNEKNDIDENERMPKQEQVLYKKKEFWGGKVNSIYWCNLDIKKFYPSIRTTVIKENILKNISYLPNTIIDADEFGKLLDSILRFKLDLQGLSQNDVEKLIHINSKREIFDGIPTGLFAAGFLSNISFLEIDKILAELVNNRAKTKGKIALFRFVDDFTILAEKYSNLLDLIELIQKLLIEKMGTNEDGFPNVELNLSKTKPTELRNYLLIKYNSLNQLDECVKLNKNNEKYCEYLIGEYNSRKHLNKICVECKTSEEQLCKYLFSRLNSSIPEVVEMKYNNISKKIEESAKRSCELDPKFPAALMNQTLKKISLVNRTPFELLDESEEEQLISDLEHLLVSDLPDEEIRKDTRISFASSRLSRYVPKMQLNSTFSYNKKYYEIVKEQIKIEIEKMKTEKSEKVNMEMEIAKIKINDIDTIISEQNKKISEIYLSQNNRINAIFQLLLKSINDYPEKLILWKNTLKYCEQTGCDKSYELLRLIVKLKKHKKINNYTECYLYTYFFDSLSKSLMKISGMDLENIGSIERERLSNYIKSIFSSRFLSLLLNNKRVNQSSIYYVKQARDLFRIVLGSFIYSYDVEKTFHVKSRKIEGIYKKYDILNWAINPYQYVEERGYNLDDTVWWLINMTKLTSEKEPPKFISSYIKVMNIKRASALATMTLLPRNIESNVIIKILEENPLTYFPFGWWNEVVNFNKNFTKVDLSKQDIQNNNYNKFNSYNEKNKENTSIPIYNYICSERNNEITALKIIREIIKIVIENDARESDAREIEFDNYKNEAETCTGSFMKNFPYNIHIIEEIKDGMQVFKGIQQIEMGNISINDKRYMPELNSNSHEGDKLQILFGMGVLFIQLLAKDSELNNKLFLPGNQITNLNLYFNKLKEKPISSFSLEIVDACISAKKRESVYLKKLTDNLLKMDNSDILPWFEFEDESFFVADDMTKLLKAIEKSISEIEKSTYYFKSGQRTLIPIHLINMQDKDFS